MVSLFILIVVCYLAALSEFYFWDIETKLFVMQYFRDWHYLKTLLKISLFVSIFTLPNQPVYIAGWFLISWFGFEMSCAVIPKIDKYHKTNNHIIDFFYIGNPIISFILILLTLILVKYYG